MNSRRQQHDRASAVGGGEVVRPEPGAAALAGPPGIAKAARKEVTSEVSSQRGKARAWRRTGTRLAPYLVVALPAGFVVFFVAYPSILAIVHSFQNVNEVGQASGFAGATNYQTLFASGLFRQAVVNTLIYGSVSVVLCVALSLGLALLIGPARRRTPRVLMVSIFSPTILPMIAAANIWAYFLAPRFGLLDHLLSWFGLGRNLNLLGEPGTALAVLVALFLWKYVPYFTLFILAGLQAIPPDVIEALRTEDPHRLYGFRKVILPILAPMLLFVTTMALLSAFETIDSVYALTQGGPDNGTNLVLFYLYQLGFNYFSWGPAAALSAIILVTFSTIAGLSLISLERRAFHWQ